MSAASPADRAESSASTSMRRLIPPGAAVTAAELVAEWGRWERSAGRGGASRPSVMLNMVSSLDGHATLGGLSGALSGSADRQMFHALRAAADAVLVGAGTVRAEGYRALIRDQGVRRLRLERGLSEQPLACVVSASLDVPAEVPLMADADSHVVIITASRGELAPGARAQVDYLRSRAGGRVDLAAALVELAARFGVQTVLCEGGPHLAAGLLGAGLVDELCLCLAPKLVGDAAEGAELRILASLALDPALTLELISAVESESQLFLRYRVPAPELVVSRETTASSSPAS